MKEDIILSSLIYNEDYARKVIPFLKPEYFQDSAIKEVYDVVDNFIKKYNTQPTKEAIKVELDSKTGINETRFKEITSIVDRLVPVNENLDWLIEKTEDYCKDRAVVNALYQSIQIVDGKDNKFSKNAIPGILTDALAVSFDGSIGHNFLDDSEARYDFYHRKESKIPFDLEYFNKITRGGLSQKSLNIILAGTGVGKTMFMCHCAATNLMQGHNVLYITMEMAEERIAERIDANLLNVATEELEILPKDVYLKKVGRVKEKTSGKLIIKEYPTASAGSIHFRTLIEDLKIKKNFVPEVIYIDYLNICMSSRLKLGASVNSYTYIKAIAEELRGLAVEYKVPIVSATQTTRSGYTNADLGLEDTSESFGLPATADFMFALITTEELATLNQVMVKQLKNRYSDPNVDKRFVVGVDRPKMKFYDTEQHSQADILDGPIMDSTHFGERNREEVELGRVKKKRKSVGGFNF